MSIRVLLGCAIIAGGLPLHTLAEAPRSSAVRMNHIQVIGTHNSYHLRPDPLILETFKAFVPDAEAWDYSHPPLPVQLDRGVRNFELDLYRYKDGYRVFHVPHYDDKSTCPYFKDCLEQVRAWSEANPGHLPISFLLEVKQEEAKLSPEPTLALDTEGLHAIDGEILSVFPEEKLITPDKVRGDMETLEKAVLEKGWPDLEWSRGKVFFTLHEQGELRDNYVADAPSLENRAMFIRSAPGRPDAAVLIMDNPFDEAIPDRVREGYFVRTRVDSGLRQGRSGDTSRFEQGLISGAHILTTDFPPGSAHEETGYVVAFPGGAAARCNPINAPAACADKDAALLR